MERFPHYWPFVGRIHRWPVDLLSQRASFGATFILAWTTCWVVLRRHYNDQLTLYDMQRRRGGVVRPCRPFDLYLTGS